MYRIAKRFAFSASHQLDSLPPEHPCSRLHGHNYEVEVIVTGELDEHGFVVDYREIDGALWPYIRDHLDHRHLNDVLSPSTAENLARHLHEQIASHFPGCRVRVSETPKTWAEYRP